MARAPRVPATPFGLALRWLSVRDRTEHELRTRLRRAEIAPEQIDLVIERVRRLGYLDDERFAKARSESLLARGRLGPRAVAQKLRVAGVARATVDGAVADAMSRHDELGLARRALEKKHPAAIGSADPKLRAKAVRFLLARGFSSAAARQAVQGR